MPPSLYLPEAVIDSAKGMFTESINFHDLQRNLCQDIIKKLNDKTI